MSLDSVFKGWRQFLNEEDELTEGSEEWIARAENFIEDNPDPAAYPFNDMFDGQFRQVVPMTGDKMALHVGTELRKEDYRIVAKPETKTITRTGEGGRKYQEEVTLNTLFAEKDTVIPKGPKAGETRTTTQKLGRTIRKEFGANSKEYKWWEKNQTFYGEDENYLALTNLPEYSIVVSRHPIDIMRMSDFSWAGITSCHREGGEYQKCVPGEVAAQGGVAYVVKTSDLEDVGDLQGEEVFADPDRDIDGIAPIARHRLRRFDNDQDKDATGAEGYSLLVPDMTTYGKKVRKFYDALRDWSYESQVGKAFEEGAKPKLSNFVSRGGTYFDVGSRPGSMFNEFFQLEGDDQYNPNARMPHQREDAEVDFVAGRSGEREELEEAVEENNNWAATYLEHSNAFASVEEVDEDRFYVMFGASMELEFDNVPYNPAFKDYRSKSVLETAIERGAIGGDDASIEDATVYFYPNNNQKVNEQEAEADPDNPIMGRLDVSLQFSSENYDYTAEGYEEFVRDIGSSFDSRFAEVKDDVYITLAKEGALPERPFDTFKRMIEDDEFPEFKNFEVHPEDGPNEIEFRMTTAAVSQNVIGKYNPSWLNNALARLWDTIDSRMFGFTTQEAIERSIKVSYELWDYPTEEARRARAMRTAATKMPTGLQGLAFDADEGQIVKVMMRRMKLDRGKNMLNIPLSYVWGGTQDAKALKYSPEYSNLVMQRLGEFNQKAKEAAAKQLNLPFADKGEQRSLNFMDKYTHDEGDVVDDLDFNSLGFKAEYAQTTMYSDNKAAPNKSNIYGGFGLSFDGGMTEEEGKAAIAFMKYVDDNADQVSRIMYEVMMDGIKQFQLDMIEKIRNRWPKVKKEIESVLPEDAIALPFGHMKASIVRDLSAEEQKVSDEVKKGGVGGPIAERIVRNVMKRLGTKSPLIREALFKTLETKKLVKEDDEQYDLLLYAIPVRISIAKSLGGDKTQTFNEIRGIEGVTVVRDIQGTSREDDKNYYSTVVIKFELLSGKGPMDYKSKELIPGLKQIKGLIVYNIGDVEQVRM
jgi:hypothetical protein